MSRRTLVSLLVLAALAGGGFLLLRPDDGVRTIVLVTVDTLRRDYVSAYAPEGALDVVPQTPHMDKLARSGLRFADARTPVPLTLPAHVTMLTGRAPAETGVRLNTYGRLAPPDARGFPLLQERLQADGWKTGAFVSAAVLAARYGLDQGFDHYDDRLPAGEETPGLEVHERPGEETVDAALAWLKGRGEGDRVFLWVHVFEPHAPYGPSGYPGDVIGGDDVVGRLLDGLEAAGRSEAAVLLTSDHGEGLGELNERTHGLLLGDAVMRIPFLLRAPGLEPGVREDPVELADVAPTLAGLAGLPWEAPGLDLLAGPAPAGRVRLSESLYAHHRFRWAQLLGATGQDGTLVDAGRGRLHWLAPPGFRQPQRATGTVDEGPTTGALARAIAEYKSSEQADRMVGDQTAAGYGGSGPVQPFLPSEENARLPDPFHAVARAHELDQVKRVISDPKFRTRKHLEAQVRRLEAMTGARLDAGSPEHWFFLGEARFRLGALPDGDPADLEKAEQAFTEAFRLGRKDTPTLARACGANAVGREAEALAKLEALGRQLPRPGCQYWILKAKLLKALPATPERKAEIEAACEAADRLCTSARERILWDRTCR